MKQLRFFKRKNNEEIGVGSYDDALLQLEVVSTNQILRTTLLTILLEIEASLGERYDILQEETRLVVSAISNLGVMKLKQTLISGNPEVGVETYPLS